MTILDSFMRFARTRSSGDRQLHPMAVEIGREEVRFHIDLVETGAREERARMLGRDDLDVVEIALRDLRQTVPQERCADAAPVMVAMNHAPAEERHPRFLPSPSTARDTARISDDRVANRLFVEKRFEVGALLSTEERGRIRVEDGKARWPIGCRVGTNAMIAHVEKDT
jgi:hypothetical protein